MLKMNENFETGYILEQKFLNKDKGIFVGTSLKGGGQVIGVHTCSIVPKLDKCLKFMTFRGGGGKFCTEYSNFHLQTDMNFRHFSSCDTIHS